MIDDIREVKEEEEREVKGGVVVGVKYFESYMSCYSYKGKVVESESGFGECRRCGMMQSLKRCKVMSTAEVDVEGDGTVFGATVFSLVVKEVCEGEPSKVGLLSARQFTFLLNNKNVTYKSISVVSCSTITFLVFV